MQPEWTTLICSTRTGHADLLAHLKQRAGRTFRALTSAEVLAEGHQQPVDLDPVNLRQLFHQCGHGLLWRFRGDIAPAVCHPMHVNVDANVGLITTDAEHEARALRP